MLEAAQIAPLQLPVDKQVLSAASRQYPGASARPRGAPHSAAAQFPPCVLSSPGSPPPTFHKKVARHSYQECTILSLTHDKTAIFAPLCGISSRAGEACAKPGKALLTKGYGRATLTSCDT